jgi:hypothetical protein
MFKQFINTLNGNENYMLLSLFIFFAFFVVATIYLIRIKKAHIHYMSDLPLHNETVEKN